MCIDANIGGGCQWIMNPDLVELSLMGFKRMDILHQG
jgi:hypothetical protein